MDHARSVALVPKRGNRSQSRQQAFVVAHSHEGILNGMHPDEVLTALIVQSNVNFETYASLGSSRC